MRFSTISETEDFITSLEDILSDKHPKGRASVDAISAISSESEFVPPAISAISSDQSEFDPPAIYPLISLSSFPHTDGHENPVMLDAPVSGGILAAEAGTLTFMVGGAEEAYLAAKPLFHAMGRTSIYCGGAGNGLVAKICNNLVLATSMIGVSEALAVGQSLGISASTLTRILNCSTGRCWSSDTYNPVPGVMKGVPSSRDYQGGCSSKILAKDLNLATILAEEAAIKHPTTEQANEIFHELCKEGHEAKDFSCIFRYYYGGRDEFPQS